jgi:hypothetical protein
LEDGREIINQEMKKPKYNNYSGREVFIDVAVYVQPENAMTFGIGGISQTMNGRISDLTARTRLPRLSMK